MAPSFFAGSGLDELPRAGLPALGERFSGDGITLDLFPTTPFKTRFFLTQDLILISLRGEVEVTVPGLENRSFSVLLQPNRFHFMPKGIIACIDSRSKDGDLIGFSLSKEFRRRAQVAMSTHFEPRHLFNVNSNKAAVLGDWVKQFYHNRQCGGELVATAITTLVTALVAEAFREPSHYATTAPRPTTADRSIDRSLEFIELNLQRNIQLKDLASAACQSLFHFSRNFAQVIGKTPKAYLNERRIERAKQMLISDGDASIGQVASACGFNSQSHLSTVFKRQTGRTPNQFRKEVQAGGRTSRTP